VKSLCNKKVGQYGRKLSIRMHATNWASEFYSFLLTQSLYFVQAYVVYECRRVINIQHTLYQSTYCTFTLSAALVDVLRATQQ